MESDVGWCNDLFHWSTREGCVVEWEVNGTIKRYQSAMDISANRAANTVVAKDTEVALPRYQTQCQG